MDDKKDNILLYENISNNKFQDVLKKIKNPFTLKKTGMESNLLFVFDTFDLRFINKRMLLYYSKKHIYLKKIKKQHSGKLICSQEINKIPKKIQEITKEECRKEIEEISENRAFFKFDKILQKTMHFETSINGKVIFEISFISYFKFIEKRREIIKTFFQINFNKKNNDKIKKQIISYFTGSSCKKSELTILDIISNHGAVHEQLNIYNKRISLKQESPLIENFEKIFKNLIEFAKLNIEGMYKDIDIEFLHDFRVTIRKIRSLTDLCGSAIKNELKEKMDSDFKIIGKSTNKLRDIDVYLLNKMCYMNMLPLDMRGDTEIFFNRLDLKRASELNKVRVHINEIREILDFWNSFNFKGDIIGLDGLKNSINFAKLGIYTQYIDILEAKKTLNVSSADDDFHNIRIKFKKLKYMLSFFTSLFPEDEVSSFISSLKKLQNVLGAFNDTSIQVEKLQKFADKKANKINEKKTIMAFGYLIGSLKNRQAAAKNEIIKVLGMFPGNNIIKKIKIFL